MKEKADIRVQITVRRIQKLTIKIKSIAAMLCAIHFRKICIHEATMLMMMESNAIA